MEPSLALKLIEWIDRVILFCFCVLVIFLPIAHTESIRAFAMCIPAGLWIIKAILCRRFLFARTPMDLPIILFTLVAGLSVITAVDPRYSLEEFIGEWLIGISVFYVAVNNTRPEQVKYILGALLVGNLIMVGYGIFDFFRQGGILFEYKVRAASLHSGMGTFGTYLVTITPFILVGFFFVRNSRHFLAILILFSLNFFVLLLNFSLGAWVAIAALFILIGLEFLKRKVLLFPILLLLIGIFFLFPNPNRSFYHRFTDLSKGPDAYNTRWTLAKFSLEKIKKNPFRMIGFGQRSFAKQYKSFVQKYKGLPMWHAHNTFLNIALQTGLQGLILFCFLLYRLLKYCHEQAKAEENYLKKFYITAIFTMVITFFIRNLSDDFFIDDSALLFWFLCGIVFAFHKAGLTKKHEAG
jgi:O-antigen ligase